MKIIITICTVITRDNDGGLVEWDCDTIGEMKCIQKHESGEWGASGISYMAEHDTVFARLGKRYHGIRKGQKRMIRVSKTIEVLKKGIGDL